MSAVCRRDVQQGGCPVQSQYSSVQASHPAASLQVRPPPPKKRSCIGITRPTLKIPPTLDFFFYCTIFVNHKKLQETFKNKAISRRKTLYGLCSMFQACVSISACILFVSMEYIHRVCVYKWAYCWVKQIYIDLPTIFFSSRYANTTTTKFGPKISYLSDNTGPVHKGVDHVPKAVSDHDLLPDWVCDLNYSQLCLSRIRISRIIT